MINLTPLKISGNLTLSFQEQLIMILNFNPSPSIEKLTPLIPSEISMINLTPLKISGNLTLSSQEQLITILNFNPSLLLKN